MTTPSLPSRAYGLWDSPISPLSLARGLSFNDLAWSAAGHLVWREGRSDRAVLVIQPPDGQAVRDLNSDFNVRARLGYGGGDFCLAGPNVYFVEAVSGRIYRQPLEAGSPATAEPVTPGFGAAAAPQVSPDGRWLLFIHSYEDRDVLAVTAADGKRWPAQLASGQDFYMQARWSPDGWRVAYISWDHPNMPWDGTTLTLAELDFGGGLPRVERSQVIAGGDQISILQPEFSPDGRWLAYISDESGWWQLYLYDLSTGKSRQLTHVEAEHGQPAWVQGQRNYVFSPDSRSISFIRNQAGRHSLWQLELGSGAEQQIPLAGYTSLDQPAFSPDGQRLACIASAGDTPTRIISFDSRGQGQVQIHARSSAENLPAQFYSRPEHLGWPGMDGETAYGLFYAPVAGRFSATGAPPLIVNIHGGPTSQRVAGFTPPAQFFTSRGYAYLDVNYRGSTGYGRAYRNKLRTNWGIYDVQDAVSGARSLAEQGRVDGSRMVIMGGSAGGFTVLQTLEDYPGAFKAGICLYGVSNQFILAADTHKFEARYSDSLLGPLPEAAELYRQRSPLFFADKIRDPLAVFQGEDDNVVPRAQSDEVVEALRRRGVPHIYHLYPGEGHGFRKTETIEHFYTTAEKFLRQYVIFA